MAKRKKGLSVVDALNAFSKTYTMTRGVMQNRDLAKVADAKATQDTGFVAEQGDQLDAIANAKDENGKPFYNVAATEDGKYQVTPNKAVFDARGADAELTNSTSEIAPAARYSILGETRATPFSDQEQDSIRTRAMAGVFSKYGDPVKAMQLRTQAGQLDNQALQAQQAQQGLELGKLQIAGAERANKAGERQDAATDAITEAGLKQSEAAAQSDNYSQYQKDLVSTVKGRGVEAMVRANAGPDASESEIQQAIAAYKQSIGDAQANQNAASMKSLYEHQGQIWNGVGGDPVKAAAAYKMAEAEGMPQVIEQLKSGNVDAANKIWNSNGQGKGIITQVGKDGKGNLYATVIDPFSGASSHVNVSDMERQLLSLKELTAVKAGEANIAQSQAAIRQGDARVANDTRSTNAAVARSGVETANARAELDYMRKNGVKMPSAASGGGNYKVEMGEVAQALGTPATNRDGSPLTDPMTGRQVINRNPQKEQAFFAAMDSAGIKDTNQGLALFMAGKLGAPAGTHASGGLAVGTTRMIGGRKAQWDGRGWKAVQ